MRARARNTLDLARFIFLFLFNHVCYDCELIVWMPMDAMAAMHDDARGVDSS